MKMNEASRILKIFADTNSFADSWFEIVKDPELFYAIDGNQLIVRKEWLRYQDYMVSMSYRLECYSEGQVQMQLWEE